MGRPDIDRFFADITRDAALHRALLKRSRSPAEFHAQAVKLARLLGYDFTVEDLRGWVQDGLGGPLAESPANPHAETPAEGTASSPPAAADATAAQPHWSVRSFGVTQP